MFPEYTIETQHRSAHVAAVAGPISGSVGVSDELLRLTAPFAGEHAFYRVAANIKLAPPRAAMAMRSSATHGIQPAASKHRQISLADFTARYAPTNEYLPRILFRSDRRRILGPIQSRSRRPQRDEPDPIRD
jgi:hypothetical protein